jgi:hypothetical protein
MMMMMMMNLVTSLYDENSRYNLNENSHVHSVIQSLRRLLVDKNVGKKWAEHVLRVVRTQVQISAHTVYPASLPT